jgi:hypothetical protein
MNTIARRAGAAVAAALLLASAAAAADPPRTLDKALRDEAPGILKALHDGHYANVGVLKFLAARGDGKLCDNLGPINRSLADRLEVALVLAQDDKDKLCVLTHASDVVAQQPFAAKLYSHLTEDGLKRFFDPDRPLLFNRPWGGEADPQTGQLKPVTADAFLTGEARLSPDLKTVDVTVRLFDRNDKDPNKLREAAHFTALVDWRTLTESGVSFVRPRGNDIPDPDAAPVPATVVLNDDKEPYYRPDDKSAGGGGDWGKVEKESPVRLEIYYLNAATNLKDPGDVKKALNGATPVPVKDGATVRPPKEGEKVVFKLKNTDDGLKNPGDRHTYGVVLRVNGENTIEREKLTSALDSVKWILDPGDEITVAGFQVGKSAAEEFKVLSPQASKEQMVNYDLNNIGTISMVVFRANEEKTKNEVALARRDDNLDAEAERMKSVGRGSLSVGAAGPPMDLKALKGALEADTKARGSRDAVVGRRGAGGLIVAGDKVASDVQQVAFRALPEPVASVVIYYYKPEP